MIRVTVWNEYLHEKEEPVRHIYPNGIHGCIKEFLQTDEVSTNSVKLQEISSKIEQNTDRLEELMERWETIQ